MGAAAASGASDSSIATATAHTSGATRCRAVTPQRLHGPDTPAHFASTPRLEGAGLPHAAAEWAALAPEVCRCCRCHCFGAIHAALGLGRTIYLSVCRESCRYDRRATARQRYRLVGQAEVPAVCVNASGRSKPCLTDLVLAPNCRVQTYGSETDSSSRV